jgi:hypothetical protein
MYREIKFDKLIRGRSDVEADTTGKKEKEKRKERKESRERVCVYIDGCGMRSVRCLRGRRYRYRVDESMSEE